MSLFDIRPGAWSIIGGSVTLYNFQGEREMIDCELALVRGNVDLKLKLF